jgi:hypothetical protein
MYHMGYTDFSTTLNNYTHIFSFSNVGQKHLLAEGGIHLYMGALLNEQLLPYFST